jgi:hypothetical protein
MFGAVPEARMAAILTMRDLSRQAFPDRLASVCLRPGEQWCENPRHE